MWVRVGHIEKPSNFTFFHSSHNLILMGNMNPNYYSTILIGDIKWIFLLLNYYILSFGFYLIASIPSELNIELWISTIP